MFIMFFQDFSYFLRFSLLFHKHANQMIYKSDHRKIDVCLGFNLKPILVL